jgi:hypothetical protein
MSLINLSPAFTMRLPVDEVQSIGVTPTGERAYFLIPAGGTLTLPDGSLAANFLEGGDWAILQGGFAKLDVRVHAKTVDTNEMIYITFTGHMKADDLINRKTTSGGVFVSPILLTLSGFRL